MRDCPTKDDINITGQLLNMPQRYGMGPSPKSVVRFGQTANFARTVPAAKEKRAQTPYLGVRARGLAPV